MKVMIHISNFGKLEKADVELGKFIVFVGENNSGKTYLMQLIYGFIQRVLNQTDLLSKYDFSDAELSTGEIQIDSHRIYDMQEKLNEEIKQELDDIILSIFKTSIPIETCQLEFILEENDTYLFSLLKESNNLNFRYILNVSDDQHDHKEYYHTYTGESSYKVLFNLLLNAAGFDLYTTFFPAARTGLQLLYKEYFLNMTTDKFKGNLTSKGTSLTTPLYDYLNYLQSYYYREDIAELNKKLIVFLQEHLLDGKLNIGIDVTYTPVENKNIEIPLYVASSMISELLPFYYLLTRVENYTTLIVDEIESSLHPHKQLEIVRMLNRLCNQGKRIIISTHSDNITNKINNLFMLSKRNQEENIYDILERCHLEQEDILVDSEVLVYNFEKHNGKSIVEKVKYNERFGYSFTEFENAVSDLIEEAKAIF